MLRFCDGTAVKSRPSTVISPDVACSSPAITRSVVVLPQPDGPSIVKNSPPRTSKETPSTAVTVAAPTVNRLVKLRTDNAACRSPTVAGLERRSRYLAENTLSKCSRLDLRSVVASL